MADQVASICDQLVKAVDVMMDAETSQIYRLEALKVSAVAGSLASLCPEPSLSFIWGAVVKSSVGCPRSRKEKILVFINQSAAAAAAASPSQPV